MTLIERGDAYIVLPGGTGTLAELALAWEIMNKVNLSGAEVRPKPLLVMAPYWQPVVECLKQEGQLGSRIGASPDRAQGLVKLVTDAGESVDYLRNRL